MALTIGSDRDAFAREPQAGHTRPLPGGLSYPGIGVDAATNKPDVPRPLGRGFRGPSGEAGFEVDSGAEI
jgi:hypothetical protein